MEDILNTIKEENEERIKKDEKRYYVKIKELQPIEGEETEIKIRSWYFDGLYFKKKFHKAIITMYSENQTIGKTKGGLDIHSPVTIKIFPLGDIVVNENLISDKPVKGIEPIKQEPKELTEKQKAIITMERQKPKAKKGEKKTNKHRKSINELAEMMNISNRRIMAYCKKMEI